MSSSPSRRVLFAAPQWPPELSTNGITSYVTGTRDAMHALGESTAVVSLDVKAPSGDDVYDARARGPLPLPLRVGLRPLHFASKALFTAVQSGAMYARELRAHPEVDIFEIEESFGLACAVRPTFRGGLVVRLHGPWEVVGPASGAVNDAEFRARVWAEWCAMRVADAVTAPSAAVLRGVQERHGVELPHAHVIPNPAQAVAEAKRWSPGIRVRDRILCVGRFDRVKGPDLLFQAFEEIVRKRPSAELIFVGPDVGLDVNGARIGVDGYLQRYVSAQARGRIVAKGPLPPSEVAELRRTAHVTVVASRFETFSLACSEALSAACPLIASNVGGIPEIVRDGDNGLLFRSEDSEDLAARIDELLGNDALAERLSRQAVSDCALRFSPRTVAAQSLEVYEAARESRRRR